MRLEGVAPLGPPAFILVARGGDATLLLPRDERVVTGASPEDVLGALTGVALAPADLHAVLTGCVVPDPTPRGGRVHANGWASIDLDGNAVLYLRRVNGSWQPQAATRQGWDVQYSMWQGDFPRRGGAALDVRGRRGALGDGEPARSQRAARRGRVHRDGAARHRTADARRAARRRPVARRVHAARQRNENRRDRRVCRRAGADDRRGPPADRDGGRHRADLASRGGALVSARRRGVHAGAAVSRRLPVREHRPEGAVVAAQGGDRDRQGRAAAGRRQSVLRRRVSPRGERSSFS